MGSVVTFYSYKGGVGRSMALANIAVLLARVGKRVLIVDWDLEAPGLDRYFHYFRVIPDGAGLMSMMTDASSGYNNSYSDYTWTIDVGSVEPIKFLSSGREQDPSGYSSKLESFDWNSFFMHGGGDYLEDLRRQWKSDFDFVLIDSRTGLSDTGGVCTIQLPDVVVVMFTANDQSMLGARDVMHYVRRARQSLAYPRMELTVFPLPARISSVSEFQESQKWIDRFSKEFAEFYDDWLPSWAHPKEVLQKVKIPQVDFFGFGEKLPVVEQGVQDPSGMGYAYDLVARILGEGFKDVHETLGLREHVQEERRFEPAGDYEWDLYISCPELSYLIVWVEDFLDRLRFELEAEVGRSPNIFWDRRELVLGKAWPDPISHALLHSRLLLPILIPAYFSSAWHVAEWRTFEARESLAGPDKRLISPVALRTPDLFPDYAKARQYLDVTAFPPRASEWSSENVQTVRYLARGISQMLHNVPSFRPSFPLVHPGDVEITKSLAAAHALVPELMSLNKAQYRHYRSPRIQLWRAGPAGLGHGPVSEAQHHGNRPERQPEPRSGLVWRVRVVNIGPAHLQVLGRQPGHRVREFHGRDAVRLEQPAPPERGEHAGQLQHRQGSPSGQIDQVYGVSQLDKIAGALRQGG
jgi:MinD-like ATPase involved in chromosome partitioning or flagellar assembly